MVLGLIATYKGIFMGYSWDISGLIILGGSSYFVSGL